MLLWVLLGVGRVVSDLGVAKGSAGWLSVAVARCSRVRMANGHPGCFRCFLRFAGSHTGMPEALALTMMTRYTCVRMLSPM